MAGVILFLLICGTLASAAAMKGISRAIPIKEELYGFDPIPGIRFSKLQATHHATPDERVYAWQPMRGIKHPASAARSAAAVLGHHKRQLGGGGEVGGYTNITAANAYGMQYAVDVAVGGVWMSLILDTGSSDVWVVADNFTCLDYMKVAVDQSQCSFGPTYKEDFTGGTVDGIHLFVKYGDGEFAAGPMGKTDVTISNFTIPDQQLAIVNATFWYGDNTTSGLLGLAYQSLTNAYYGDLYTNNDYAHAPYRPVFTSMWQLGLVQPMFSIAISRNSSSGILAWGGIPYVVTGLDYSKVAYAPIVVVRTSTS